jgi:Flp pilus assembly protein TadD
LTSLQEAISAHQAGKAAEAERLYQALLDLSPENPDALNAYGILLLQTNRAELAQANFRAAVEFRPDVAKYQVNLASARLAVGETADALAGFEAAEKLDPGNPEINYNIATCCLALGDAPRAETVYHEVLKLNPDHYRTLHNLGSLLSKQNRLNDALDYLRKASRQAEATTETRINLTSVLERTNQLEEGASVLDEQGDGKHPMFSVLRARLLRRSGKPDAGLSILQDIEVPGSDEVAGDRQHEMGLCADQAGSPDIAFPAFLAAREYWRKSDRGADAESYLQKVTALRNLSEPSVLPVSHLNTGPQLVFFTGFPRSGTTLLEAMLGAHPRVATTAEAHLLEPVLETFRQDPAVNSASLYLDRFADATGHRLAPDQTIVDKLPLNLVHCRAIAASMPEARLIVALRDPRDVVLSCLMQRFRRNAAMQNFDTLEGTVRLYEEVMGAWLEARADLQLPWLEYRYEDLVADQKAVLTRVLDFCDLTWQDEIENYQETVSSKEVITPSYAGVGEPIYHRAVGRWRAYRQHLEPVLDRLAPFARAFGYED